jgi:hypothetical protein
MFHPGKIFIFGIFVAVSYSVFPTGQPAHATVHASPFVLRANAFCMVEQHFRLHEVAKPLGLNATLVPLGFDPCGPGEVMPYWLLANDETDDDEQD